MQVWWTIVLWLGCGPHTLSGVVWDQKARTIGATVPLEIDITASEIDLQIPHDSFGLPGEFGTRTAEEWRLMIGEALQVGLEREGMAARPARFRLVARYTGRPWVRWFPCFFLLVSFGCPETVIIGTIELSIEVDGMVYRGEFRDRWTQGEPYNRWEQILGESLVGALESISRKKRQLQPVRSRD
jgi:hypothetical protein